MVIAVMFVIYVNDASNNRMLKQFQVITDEFNKKREEDRERNQEVINKIVNNYTEKLERIMGENEQSSQQTVHILKAIKPVLSAFIDKSDTLIKSVSKARDIDS